MQVLANRLKFVLPAVISEAQSGFVPGRLITDNIMVAYEVNHYMKQKRQGKHGTVALKLDMSKAYDQMEWRFLKDMMLALSFHHIWVGKIMACIESVSYHLIQKGERMGPIKPSRGSRQGDPLSPFSFILCAEG